MDGSIETAANFAEITETIRKSGRISDDDTADLRRSVFADGVVSWDEARLVAELHNACDEHGEDWDQFYVDALTDFLIWSAEPQKYVDETKAAFIRDSILHDGKIDSESELALLVNVVHWAASCPEDLVELAMGAVRTSVVAPDQAAYGQGRRPNQIDDIDVGLLRKVIFAGGSHGGFTVSRSEADILVSLHEATRDADNSAEWRDLFVSGVANYLMFPRGAQAVPTAEEYAAREEWLAERRGAGKVLLGVMKNVGSLNYAKVWRDADPFGTRQAERREQLQAERMAEAFQREGVDAGETAWVLDRLGGDGDLHPDVEALFQFIADNATTVEPALERFLAEKGVKAKVAAE